MRGSHDPETRPSGSYSPKCFTLGLGRLPEIYERGEISFLIRVHPILSASKKAFAFSASSLRGAYSWLREMPFFIFVPRSRAPAYDMCSKLKRLKFSHP